MHFNLFAYGYTFDVNVYNIICSRYTWLFSRLSRDPEAYAPEFQENLEIGLLLLFCFQQVQIIKYIILILLVIAKSWTNERMVTIVIARRVNPFGRETHYCLIGDSNLLETPLLCRWNRSSNSSWILHNY